MILLVSACLLGEPCRYDGASKPFPGIPALLAEHTIVPVCPEQLGGLPTPRPPAERRGDRVITAAGDDVTRAYCLGAEETLRLCRQCGAEAAVLKERSPSCGCGEIYDGTFTGTTVPGNGVTAALLQDEGIPVCGESRLAEYLK